MKAAILVWTTVAACGILVAVTLLLVAGQPPIEVLGSALARFGNPRHLAASLEDAAPLLLCALACSVAMRSGVLNIGGEGQYLVGMAGAVAMMTTWRGSLPAPVTLVLAAALAMACGAVWAGLADQLRRRRGVNEVLSTILLNFIALHLVSWLVEGPLSDPATTAPQSATLAEDLRLEPLVRFTSFHIGVILAVVIAILVWIGERRTRFGFECGVVGLNPEAAHAFAIPVETRRLQAMLIGGALAGLGGMLQLSGVTAQMTASTRSFGYLGVAVALLGGLHPLGLIAAAAFFALLDGLGRGMERIHDVPRDLTDIIKGVVLLAALVGGAILAARRRRQVEDA